MKETTLRFYKERLLRVLIHIQQQLDEPLPLKDLARVAGLSPHHFHHVFRGMLGESLAGHIRRLRLERAASRLKLDRAAVIHIALEAGYATHEAFSRAFKSNFGLSPSNYRKLNRAPAEIPVPSGVHYHENANLAGFRARPAPSKTMKVEIKKFNSRRVAFMRHVGPYNQVGRVWEQFCTFLGKEGLLGGGAQFIGLCHDDPDVTPADKIRYDACLEVDDAFQPSGEVGVQVIAGGDYAVMTHFGPYEKLSESYAKLFGQWLPRSGRRLRPLPSFEVYFNSPENTAPGDLITDIHAPLEP